VAIAAQLPLGLVHDAHYGRDTFVVGAPNYAALALVERWPDWPQNLVLLSGPEGSGKTHLAHIWAERSGGEILPASRLHEVDAVRFLTGGAGVVEDIDRSVSEQALFHLINTCREIGASLLMTSRKAIGEWQVGLPDLGSRLRLAAPAVVAAPDEVLLRQILVKLFADRQLIVDRSVIDFLLPRMERSFSAAAEIVADLDREALASGRPITRPMAARLLSSRQGTSDEFTDFE
jgi:chromosomal replication initiation ATPase DnaA